jgi:hypothetical protein
MVGDTYRRESENREKAIYQQSLTHERIAIPPGVSSSPWMSGSTVREQSIAMAPTGLAAPLSGLDEQGVVARFRTVHVKIVEIEI